MGRLVGMAMFQLYMRMHNRKQTDRFSQHAISPNDHFGPTTCNNIRTKLRCDLGNRLHIFLDCTQ